MIIDGKKIAEDLRQNLKKEISNLKTNIKPYNNLDKPNKVVRFPLFPFVDMSCFSII